MLKKSSASIDIHFQETNKQIRLWLSCLGPLVLLIPKIKLFGFPISRFWVYLMKDVTETCRVH